MKISGTTGIDLSGLPINNSGNAEVEGLLTVGGNLGIGVTLSASSFTGKSLQLQSYFLTSDVNSHYQTNNVYNDGTWRYAAGTKYATRYDQDSAQGTHKWYTAPSGTAGNVITWTSAMTLGASGNLLLTSGTGGLGYGTGAGGTVTQLTSKSTAVTLNKPTGQITMKNAALAAGATAYFDINCNLCAANDLVYANIVSGIGNSAAYRVRVVNSATGWFKIGVENISAGSLSEAIVIQFSIIKGANA